MLNNRSYDGFVFTFYCRINNNGKKTMRIHSFQARFLFKRIGKFFFLMRIVIIVIIVII